MKTGNNLTEIADLFMTDKGTKFFDKLGDGHLYTLFYEKMFEDLREKPIRLLEIGAAKGSSLLMWAKYFHNFEKIIGIDIDASLVDRNRVAGQEGGGWEEIPNHESKIIIEQGDQGDDKFLTRVADRYGEFDIIIEDGSHQTAHQKIAFDALFCKVAAGGFFVWEDLHVDRAKKDSVYQLVMENSYFEDWEREQIEYYSVFVRNDDSILILVKKK